MPSSYVGQCLPWPLVRELQRIQSAYIELPINSEVEAPLQDLGSPGPGPAGLKAASLAD